MLWIHCACCLVLLLARGTNCHRSQFSVLEGVKEGPQPRRIGLSWLSWACHSPLTLFYCKPNSVGSFGFSEQRCQKIELRWRDPGDGFKWTWTTPNGWSSSQSARRFFTTSRIIAESKKQKIYDRQEWTSSTGRFSSQTGIQAIAVGRCLGNACGRWHLAFNNENYWGSSDAGGGWGLRSKNTAKSAGDWRTCCHHYLGKRRAFDANMYCK